MSITAGTQTKRQIYTDTRCGSNIGCKVDTRSTIKNISTNTTRYLIITRITGKYVTKIISYQSIIEGRSSNVLNFEKSISVSLAAERRSRLQIYKDRSVTGKVSCKVFPFTPDKYISPPSASKLIVVKAAIESIFTRTTR